MAKQKVNVFESLHWECPACCEEHDGPSWLLRGDVLKCPTCNCEVIVAEHYADCRPQKWEGKKAHV
jgi:hypothetical protein